MHRALRLIRSVAMALWLIATLVPIGFWIAASRRESVPATEAAPRTGRFVQAGDVRMFLQESGPASGPPVLLIHGTGAWSEIWRDTMTALAAAGFRAIAIDLPPFGFSDRPFPASYGNREQAARILGVLDALNLPSVTLVGHSFGGRPTMEATFMQPGRVRALVLVDAALGLQSAASDESNPSRLVSTIGSIAPVRNVIVATTLTNPMLTRRLLATLIDDPADATDARVEMVQRQFSVEGTTSSLGDWVLQFLTSRERTKSGDRQLYPSLAMPVLVLWGDRDSVTPLDQGKDIASLIPRSELVVLKNTGHIPAIEDPAQFNQALLTFLAANGR